MINNMETPAEEVAFPHKKHWTNELLFKKMKQNIQVNCFYGEDTNDIHTQRSATADSIAVQMEKAL